MSNQKVRFLAIITALIPFLLEFIRSFVRPKYGRKEFGIVSEVLGWLPNYLAGLGFLMIGLLAITLILQVTKLRVGRGVLYLIITIVAVISFGGLFLHEIMQVGTGLYYDKSDIYATIGGVLTGYAVAAAILKGYEFNDLSS